MLISPLKELRSVFKPALIVRCCSEISQDTVRVRFAPSPTGFLHLGGLRTALYNYLFAKSRNGKFILRIEDTDQTRLVPGAIEQLENDLNWSGIQIHEGPRPAGDFYPYVQSKRLDIYKEHVKTLLENGSAYHCFCTERRLELLRREASKAREVPKYDNKCQNLKPEEVAEKLAKGLQSCIRFKLSSDVERFNDLICGTISYDIAANEGDPVIMKSDGYPTYHFANVVDDHLMQISHVLRGVEWQISTTKHLLMYRAFNWTPPLFGHLPLLMNADGTKLSKRQGDITINHYRNSGIFPLALINFIVNSGGGFEKDSERHVKPKCLTIVELAEQFAISRINSHSGRLMPERLLEFNRLVLKRKLQDDEEKNRVVAEVREMVKTHFSEYQSLELSSEHIKNILNWSVNRISKLSDLLSNNFKFVWVSPTVREIDENEASYIDNFIKDFKELEDLNKDSLNKFLRRFSEKHQIKFSNFMKTLRSMLSGLKEGPGVAEMVEILGKDSTVDRLQSCLKKQVR